MLKAYFDESGNEDRPGYFGVAGFAGTEDQWATLERLWREALESNGAPYLHMREFAHSVNAFNGWRDDRERREKLMAGVVKAVLESGLTPVGSAMRTADFDALPEEGGIRLVSPYFCCLQDVLYGFALMTMDENPPVQIAVTGDQKHEYEDKAQKMYRVLRESGGFFMGLAAELTFANMRDTIGLQAADLLAYEMVKELNNQDLRPEDRVRWPFDQILAEAGSPQGKLMRYNTAETLAVQVSGKWNEKGRDAMYRQMDETLRILRNKGGEFKRRLEAEKPKD